jgi:SAM-dependent methyltransferase
MADLQIRFEDGAAYERMMGVWTRLAGQIFLDWLAPVPNLKWLDIGCGNGAFTELLVERCAPAEIEGIDPSEAQLAFARTRPAGRVAKFRQGDAMDLPYSGPTFDAAVMALVIFFVPNPAKGVAEMVRVVRPGGSVSAYAWDVPGGGLPLAPVHAEMRAMGLKPPLPPSFEASRLDDLLGGSLAQVVAAMPGDDVDRLRTRVRANLPTDAAGRITYSSRVNAVKGRVPK